MYQAAQIPITIAQAMLGRLFDCFAGELFTKWWINRISQMFLIVARMGGFGARAR